MRFKNNKKAFTLIELLVVMAVIGVLVLLATPKFLNYTQRAQTTRIVHDIKATQEKVLEYMVKNDDQIPQNGTPVDITVLNNYVDSRTLYDKKGIRIIYVNASAHLSADNLIMSMFGVVRASASDTEPTYEILDKNFISSEVKSRLKGDFIISTNGDVYYNDTKPGKVVDDNDGDEDGTPNGEIPDDKTPEEENPTEEPPIEEPISQEIVIDLTNSTLTPDNFLGTITYPSNSTNQEYKIDDGSWLAYTGPVQVPINSTIHARATDPQGQQLVSDTESLPKPGISLSTNDYVTKVVVTITYLEQDSTKEYKIGNGAWFSYTGPITVNSNTTIYTRELNSEQEIIATSNLSINNIIPAFLINKHFLEAEYEAIEPTSDGGFVVAGRVNSTSLQGYTIPYKGNGDAIVLKLDVAGDVEWITTFGGSSTDVLHAVKQTPTGYVAVGDTLSTNNDFSGKSKGGKDGIFVQLSQTGNIEVLRTFGGEGSDELTDVVVANDGTAVVVGSVGSLDGVRLTGDVAGMRMGSWEGVVANIDKTGANKWVDTIGGSNIDYLYSINKTSDGGYILGGQTRSNSHDFLNKNIGGDDAAAVKINASGVVEWAYTFGGTAQDTFEEVIQTSDGNYVGIGQSQSGDGDFTGFLKAGASDAIIVKFNSAGQILFKNSAGGNSYEKLYTVKETIDGFVAVGYGQSTNLGFATNGGIDGLIMKFGTTGNVEWYKLFGGTKSEYFHDVVVTNKGFYTVGTSNSKDGELTPLGIPQDLLLSNSYSIFLNFAKKQ